MIVVNPNVPQEIVDVRFGQDWLFLVGADGEEDDCGPVGRFARGQMNWCFALDVFVHIVGGTRFVASAYPAVSRFAMSVRWCHHVPFRFRPRRSVALRFAVDL